MKMLQWYLELTEKGIENVADSVKFGKEFIRVLNDESYRSTIYPEEYTWEQAIELINQQQLRQVFWFFLNLYRQSEKNKDLVMRSVLAYDQILKMDVMMINAYYTYGFMDPEVSSIHDGTVDVVRPDLLEEKLNAVKEIVSYIQYYRSQKGNGVQNK